MVGKKALFFLKNLELHLMWVGPVDEMLAIKQAIIQTFLEVAGELLGMFGRDMNMDLQIFLSENDTRFPFSDVLQVMKTLFDKS